MTKLQFKCQLLSDVILNVKSASEGNNQTLDFIPGSNFLGIAAAALYGSLDESSSWEIFHSGKVRFGDAHPAVGDIRSSKVPAAMFCPKYPAAEVPGEDIIYIHHLVPDLGAAKMRKMQLKQKRFGFYAFDKNKGVPATMRKTFAIKSAYDRKNRRSADNQMYGYESLCKGLELYFDVEVDNEKLAPEISAALIGTKHIGRSRTAQYGLANIVEMGYRETSSAEADGIIVVYADSRLVFFDDNNMLPTCLPTTQQLGIEGGGIVWGECQIRTFQYAPWNFKRQCFDADRFGIEKGSVIVVKGGKIQRLDRHYVGSYNNEGFGRVIYNPEFLRADGTGRAQYHLLKDGHNIDNDGQNVDINTPLLQYLVDKKKLHDMEAGCYTLVNEYVRNHKKLFTQNGDAFAAQWGAIRSIAMSCNSAAEIQSKLFDKNTGYLMHGVAKEKWDDQKRRRDTLIRFLAKDGINASNMQMVLVNLAAQMAKECSNSKNKRNDD